MLFAIGAGDQVVAADSYSDYPAAAPTTDLSAYEPNVEAIAAYDPDLVVYSDDLGDLQKSLDKLHIPALQQPAAAAIDDVYAQLEQLGQATGHTTEAQAQIDDLQAKVAAVSASVGDQGSGMTYYYELDDTYYSVTSDTFIGNLLGLLGMKNIADEAEGRELWVSATVGRIHRRGRPRSDPARRYEMLRPGRGERCGAAGVGRSDGRAARWRRRAR